MKIRDNRTREQQEQERLEGLKAFARKVEAARRKEELLKKAAARNKRTKERKRRAQERFTNAPETRRLFEPQAKIAKELGYGSGTFVSWDLGTGVGERIPSQARGAGHQRGFTRDGAWATEEFGAGGTVGYGQAFAWADQFDEGVYAETSEPDTEDLDPLVTFGVDEAPVAPFEWIPNAEGEGKWVCRDKGRARTLAGSAQGDPRDFLQAFDAEEFAMISEGISGRPLGLFETPLPKGSPKAEMIEITSGFGRQVIEIVDASGFERHALSLNGESDEAYEVAVLAIAKTGLPSLCKFLQVIEDLKSVGDTSRLIGAVRRLCENGRLVLTPEQKFELRTRFAHPGKRAALNPLRAAL